MSSLPLRWNLDALYRGFETPEFKADVAALREKIAALADFCAQTFRDYDNSAAKLEEYISRMEEIMTLAKTRHYASLVAAVDANDEAAEKWESVLDVDFSELARPDAAFRKFVGEIQGLDETISASPLLKEHEFLLREVKEDYKHSLSEGEEIILAKYRTIGSSAWETLKEQLFATLGAELTIHGETKIYPMPAIRNFAYDADAVVRKAAYEAELSAYPRVERPIAAALNAIKGEALTEAKLRGFSSPLEKTLNSSRMSRETLDALLAAVEEALPMFRRFLRKKAEMLGHDGGLPFYDLFAPVGGFDKKFTYDGAADFVVKSFSRFSPKMGAFARRAFDEGWVDSEMRDGKQGGAFCDNLRSIKESRVMANFSGSFDSAVTLAHELGHAYHGDCLKDERPLLSDYPMPIAETASTFCETIVYEAALEAASDEEKLAILENSISGDLQVCMDIYSRYLFETELFLRRESGPLSVAELRDIMLAAQKKSYGDGLDHNLLHPYMWLCKPHYYYVDSNFYNFPYAFGALLSKGLYAQFLKEGAAFPPKYDTLLAATGKNSLESVAALVGIDIQSRAFWASSLEVVKASIDKFMQL